MRIKGYPVKRVILFVKRELEGSKTIRKLIELLESKFEVVYDLPKSEARFGEDIVISVGGDGTFIAAARLSSPEIPILGVNMGRRGAMTDVLPDELPIVIERLREGVFYIEERLRLRVETLDGEQLGLAVNEVYINRVYKGVTPTYTVLIGGDRLYSERMDGVIVSTPTGSTGYNLSAGGPVLQELMDAVVITPVLPIRRVPPVVVPLDHDTRIVIESSSRVQVIVDGQLSEQEDYALTGAAVSKSREPLRIVRITDRQYQHLRKTLT